MTKKKENKTTSRKPKTKKTAAKKAASRKPANKKTTAKKTTSRKPKTKKATAKKTTSRKPKTKKTTAKKVTTRKPVTKKGTVKKATSHKPAAPKDSKIEVIRDKASGKIVYSRSASNSLSSLERKDSKALKVAVSTLKGSSAKREVVYRIGSGKFKGTYVVRSGKYRAVVEKSKSGEIKVKDIINRDAQTHYAKQKKK